MSINGKNIHEIPETGVFLDSILNFTIRVFTCGPKMIFAKKYEKPGLCLIGCVKIIQYLICEGSHNSKILQLEKQHEAAKFQNSLIYCFFINVQNVKYILSDTYFCPNSNKIEN